MTGLVVLLGVIGAALPILAASRVYGSARTAERERQRLVAERGGQTGATFDDFDRWAAGMWAPTANLRIAVVDLVLVIVGFACTAAATILGAVD